MGSAVAEKLDEAVAEDRAPGRRARSGATAVGIRFLDERPGLVAAFAALVLLTILAALPFAPEGPFDARTYERAEGVRLEFPAWGALIEPLAAVGHAVAGAPDLRVAGFSTLAWAFFLGGAVTLVLGLRRRSAAVGLRALGGAAAAGGVFLLYVGFVMLLPMSGWRLVADDPELVLADLHTHTFRSHDGVASARENLERHRAWGCDVVALTEHGDEQSPVPRSSIEAARLALEDDSLPGVIPGVEFRDSEGRFLLRLGPFPPGGELAPRVVLALAWRLDEGDVRRLAAFDIDGFEIANSGHPDVPEDVRRAILEEAEERGLVLVASSDYHGWGGFSRTWTAVRVPGVSRASAGKAAAVLAALKGRRAKDVLPVVAGYLGPPSAARAVFAPFVEAVRYAMELSPLRVVMWWVWAGIICAAAGGLRRVGLRPGRCLLSLVLLVLGGGLVYEGAQLLGAWAAGATSTGHPARVGAYGMGLGIAALLVAIALLALELRRRAAR